MNLCDALKNGKKELKAVRRKEWPSNLAWYHGMDNRICWWNSDPNSSCVYKTGDAVSFAIADFGRDDYQIHPSVDYHGDLTTGGNINE